MTMRLVLAAACLLPAVALAVPGALDPTFGPEGTGRVVTEIADDAGRATAAVLQPDGRIVVAGMVGTRSVAVARYDASGVPDPSFGDGGATTLVSGGDLQVWSVAVDPNGRILVGGNTDDGAFLLFRLKDTGDADPSFGPYDDGGLIYAPAMPNVAIGYGLLLQPDGMIVIGGPFADAQGTPALALVRLAADGKAVDGGFGNGGLASTGVAGLGRTAFALQDDGGILAVATGTPPGLGVIRLAANGMVDGAFGAAGLANAPLPDAVPAALARRGDGAIVVAGSALAGVDAGFAAARFTAAGAIDPTFAGGAVTLGLPGRDFVGEAVVVQPDGRIVVAGSEIDAQGPLRFALARLNPDGTPDASFGSGGVQTTDIGARAGAHAALLQGPDRIVAAGEGGSRAVSDIALARYDASPPPTGGGGGGIADPCAATPPTLASVACRVDALAAVVGGGEVGKLRKKLLKLLGRARKKLRRAEELAARGRTKPYQKALRGAGAALRAFDRVVGSKKGDRHIAPATQATLTAATSRIAGEMGTLSP